MNRGTLPFVTLVVAWSAVSANDALIEYKCPQRIMTVQRLAQPLDAWRQSTERTSSAFDERLNDYSEHILSTVSFSAGVPEERGWLVPDNEGSLARKKWTARWEFSLSDDIWVTCEYRRTTVMISQKVPSDVKRCFLSGDEPKGIQVQRVWCERK